MIIKKNQTIDSTMDPCCDGKGITSFARFLDGDGLPPNMNLISRTTLEKDNSIGFHVHHSEIELYYILKGEAVVQDNDKEFYTLNVGDLMYTPEGQGHAIENKSDETLEFLAIIVKV